MTEAGFPQNMTEPFLIGKGPDRSGEIFINAGRIPRDLRPDPGQQLERVPIIQSTKPAENRTRKLQANECAARFHDPANLADRMWKISDVAHAEAGGHRIKGIVIKSKMLRVRLEACYFSGQSL